MGDPGKPPIEQAIDVLVYVPLGVAAYARDMAPMMLRVLAGRGRTELDRYRRGLDDHLRQARAVGKMAVDFGTPEARRRAESHLQDARTRGTRGVDAALRTAEEHVGLARRAGTEAFGQLRDSAAAAAGTAFAAAADATDAAAERLTPAAGSSNGAHRPPAAPHASDAPGLAIPGYDELSASQVVDRMDGLDPAELEAVRVYEAAHRRRKTVLGKIAQLQG